MQSAKSRLGTGVFWVMWNDIGDVSTLRNWTRPPGRKAPRPNHGQITAASHPHARSAGPEEYPQRTVPATDRRLECDITS